MKILRCLIIGVFTCIIALPIIYFNFTPDSISEVDNRYLTENPFTLEGDLTENIESYVNDRIGFRDEMISGYTILNDKVFGKMVHPSYVYGKDGYVFGAGITVWDEFSDYHVTFADMVKQIQVYCEDRGVPFLFVFNPAKPAVYQDKIADGVNYNREWVGKFLDELDKRDINYLDNTVVLQKYIDQGEVCFNQKYDANHWNDIGAYYGTNAMLDALKEMYPSVHVNDLSEFELSQEHHDSLLVSEFPIDEDVPILTMKDDYSSIAERYSTITLNSAYQTFGYYVNESRASENTPKTLVFQGSYMNGYGYKYMINAFEEYIHIHDYQNVIDFPYYFNIFQPECVIFEVAEYTFSNTYFDYEAMGNINYNPALDTLQEDEYSVISVFENELDVEKNGNLMTIFWKTDDVYEYVWFELNTVYDMKSVEGGYQVTVDQSIEKISDSIKIYVK